LQKRKHLGKVSNFAKINSLMVSIQHFAVIKCLVTIKFIKKRQMYVKSKIEKMH